jgi:hypothetical protein
MYVPIVQVTIEPVQNGLRPAIEKSHRAVRCPEYMVNLFKAKWGHSAQVIVSKINDIDDLWQVPQLPNMSAGQSEAMRLMGYFGKKVFLEVYREQEFVQMFDEIAVEVNPREIERQERDDENREAAVKMATKAVMQAAGDAAVQARRKGGRALGSKNKEKEPVSA